MSAFVPCLVRPPEVVPRLDDAWLDEYLRIVAARAGPGRTRWLACLRAEGFLRRAENRDQVRSNRSRFMTLFHAATKSRTNFSFASSHP